MRYRRETITTIRRPHGPGLVLARRYPGDEHLRALAIEHWQHASYSPRQRFETGIHIPLSPREQTAYQSALPPELREALNGALPPNVGSRRALESERRPIPTHSMAPLDATPRARRQHGTVSIRKPGS